MNSEFKPFFKKLLAGNIVQSNSPEKEESLISGKQIFWVALLRTFILRTVRVLAKEQISAYRKNVPAGSSPEEMWVGISSALSHFLLSQQAGGCNPGPPG